MYGIVQLDTIEQCKRHHPKLDKLFPDTAVMIGLKKQVLQKSSARIGLHHLLLEFGRESVEMSNPKNKNIQYIIIDYLLHSSLEQSNDHENTV